MEDSIGRYTTIVTHPKGVPHIDITVPDDMDIDERFAVLREVAAKRFDILAQDNIMRGNVRLGCLSQALERRKRK